MRDVMQAGSRNRFLYASIKTSLVDTFKWTEKVAVEEIIKNAAFLLRDAPQTRNFFFVAVNCKRTNDCQLIRNSARTNLLKSPAKQW